MSHSAATAEYQQLLPFSFAGDLEQLDNGFSSIALSDETHVVKVGRADYPDVTSALDHVQLLSDEQKRITEYLGEEYVVPASFVVFRSGNGSVKIASVQERIKGVTIKEAQQSGLSSEKVLDFFDRALHMYKTTGEIPDLACLERRFDVTGDTNVQVQRLGSLALPRLVDTAFGRTQRRPILGRPIIKGIAWGVKRARKKLA